VEALQNTYVRAEASAALVMFGPACIPPLLELLRKEQDANILFHVRETLAQVGYRGARLEARD
jgi:hypothetical protein